MNYFISENERKASGSTCYLEFQEGYYDDCCWCDSSICISGDSWMEHKMSKLFKAVLKDFDLYGITTVSKKQWDLIMQKSQDEFINCKDIILEANIWASKCFESNDVFSILGL